VTIRYLSDWCALRDGEASAIKTAVDFVDKLGKAAHLLKTRTGPEYDALVSLCQEILGKQAKRTETIGDELNFGSPQQMQWLLYGKLGLPIRVRSKVQRGSGRDKLKFPGSPATDDEAIAAALAEDVSHDDWRYEVLVHFDKVRKASHAKSLFYRPLPLWIHPADGRIHPGITNCGTETRRPSGSSPNILQITKKDDGSEVRLRQAFKPWDDTHVIVSADFNGQEIRIMASESEDQILIDAYIGPVKKDIHSVTAAMIAPSFFRLAQFRDKFHLPEEYTEILDVSYEDYIDARHDPELGKAMNEIRKAAKSVNFLISYLGGYTTLAKRLLIKEELAKSLMDRVFAAYAQLRPWQNNVIEFARTHGYTQTAYGSRRHLGSDLFAADDGVRKHTERQAVNFVIQGGAADILKVVMQQAHETKLFEETGAFLIAPVYDELVASVPKEAAWEYASRLKSIMELTPPGHAVGMVAEFSVSSQSWGDVIEIGSEITEDKVYTALDQPKGKAA
jgi:DNA polymerase-1